MEKTKTKILTLTLILTLTFASIFVSFSIVSAHDPPWSVPTWIYVAVSRNPIGVGQTIVVTWWIDKIPPTALGAYGDRYQNVKIEVTKPDGAKETLGPFTSDPVGGGWATYTPNQLGTYTFQSIFPGQTIEGANPPPPPAEVASPWYIGDYYEPSTSNPLTLTVQQEAIVAFPDYALPDPNEYWERPIEAENRDWWKISGNWLGGTEPPNNFNQYSTGPETAHILWTKEDTFGGLAGGQYGDISYYDGISYEQFWRDGEIVIINGRLYYPTATPPRYGRYCVDIRSGEELWFSNSTGPILIGPNATRGHITYTNLPWEYPRISFGQVLDYESPNQHGCLAYIYAAYTDTWEMYDAFTGNWICNINHVPRGTTTVADDGSILIYVLNRNGWLALWNSSRALEYQDPIPSGGEAYYWMWRPPLGETVDGNKGYSWNVTIPTVPGSISGVLDDRVIGAYFSGGTYTYGIYGVSEYSLWSLSLKPESRGQLLWRKDYPSPPVLNATIQMGPADPEAGVFTMSIKETLEWYGYDINTGNQLWGPTEPQASLDMYERGRGTTAYGKLFSCSYGGILYCYDIKTGTLLWTYTAENMGFESPYGNYPLSVGAIADEKIYLYSTEHSPTKPQWRGSSLRCVDINTGNEVWKTLHWGNAPAIADGYLVDLNSYDNRIYCYGKGQTETTVMGPDDVQPLGSKVLIKGTVLDQSPGAPGTPAIADEYMSEWMEYLYKQKPCPEIVEGVEVKLETLDPNNNFYELGTVTSDASGMFKLMWEPPVPGEYTIMATFDGSESYWRSYAETAIGVEEAPSPGGPIEPEPTEAPLITTEIAILIGAVIVALALIAGFLIIRKRK
jgi:hypothetical protein